MFLHRLHNNKDARYLASTKTTRYRYNQQHATNRQQPQAYRSTIHYTLMDNDNVNTIDSYQITPTIQYTFRDNCKVGYTNCQNLPIRATASPLQNNSFIPCAIVKKSFEQLSALWPLQTALHSVFIMYLLRIE